MASSDKTKQSLGVLGIYQSYEIATGLRSKQTSTQCSDALEPQAKGTDVFGLRADQSPISQLLKAMSRPSEYAAYGKCRRE